MVAGWGSSWTGAGVTGAGVTGAGVTGAGVTGAGVTGSVTFAFLAAGCCSSGLGMWKYQQN